MNTFISDYLAARGIPQELAGYAGITATVVLLALLAFLSYQVTKRYMVHLLEMVFRRSKNTWDDALVQKGFVRRLSLFMPIIVVYKADLHFGRKFIIHNRSVHFF